MGTPLWTRITIGGKIKRNDLAKVAELMCDEDNGNWPELVGKNEFELALNELETAHKEKRYAVAYIGNSNSGGGYGLPDLLQEIGVPYNHAVENLGSEGGGISIWSPETGEQNVGHIDYCPAYSLPALQTMLSEGKTLAEVIESLQPFDKDPPPLEIVEG